MSEAPTQPVTAPDAPTAPVTQRVHWDLRYDVHLGATWGRFMAGLMDRVILGNRCPSCGRVFVPPQAFCEACFERTDEWLELPQVGTVEAVTVAWQGFRGGPTPPYVLAGITLDGADTMLMHYLGGLDLGGSPGAPPPVGAGARVRAVWAQERSGHILDIQHFAVDAS